MDINLYHGKAANLLCVGGTVQENLQLSPKYSPLETTLGRFTLKVDHPYILFKLDPEYRPLEHLLGSAEKGSFLQEYFLPLNLPNTPSNVRLRQAGVRELIEYEELYSAVQEILQKNPFSSRNREVHYNPEGEVTPESVKELVKSLDGLTGYHPQSEPFIRLLEWSAGLKQDTFFQELFRQKRKIRERRIFISVTSRFGGTEYYLLKPGIRAEDVFDRIDPSACEYKYDDQGKKKKEVHRHIVKYRGNEDEALFDLTVGQMTAQVNVVNELSARMLGLPVFLTYLQLKHLFVGAYLHQKLSSSQAMCFPEIMDDSSILEAKEVLPMRLILKGLDPYSRSKNENPVPNSFDFNGQNVIQIEGPNGWGKSEAWRTLHWLNFLTNSGYSVPAQSVSCGVIPNSHFISCKGNSAHGGSELELSLRGIEGKLKEVAAGDQVILDELGDSANAPTALEFGRRIIPVLLSRGCRVLITTQHGALTEYIRKELQGLTLTPDKQHRLRLSTGQVDSKPGEVLDQMGATVDKLGSLINPSRPYALRSTPESRAEAAERRRMEREMEPFDPEDFPF
jgi:hypothetical protein